MYKKFVLGFLAAASFVVAAPSAYAVDNAKVKAVYEEKIKSWVNNPTVINAVKAQNEKHAAMTAEEIKALDAKWAADDKTVIDPVLSNDLSKYLTDIVANGGGMYSEIFVVDNKGVNVGQSSKTSDIWQGDEPKFTETFPKGVDAFHVGEVEFDESSQTYQVQVSVTVSDGTTPIGAVTIGLNADTVQ